MPSHAKSPKHSKSANYNVIGQKKISWPNEAQGMPFQLVWPISMELANSHPRAPIPSWPGHCGFHPGRAIKKWFHLYVLLYSFSNTTSAINYLCTTKTRNTMLPTVPAQHTDLPLEHLCQPYLEAAAYHVGWQ